MKYILSLLLIGCNLIDEPHYQVDERLDLFVTEFYRQAKAHGQNISQQDIMITIAPLSCTCNGLTEYGRIPKVTIDMKFYTDHIQSATEAPDRAEYFNRIIEAVVFHELGHAILHKSHSTGLMSAESVPYHRYASDETEREKLLKELFN